MHVDRYNYTGGLLTKVLKNCVYVVEKYIYYN